MPTIFPNQPSYMTVHVPIKRKHPDERKQDLEIQDEINIEKYYYYYEMAIYFKEIK